MQSGRSHHRDIPWAGRAGLFCVGGASWVAGGVATFVASNAVSSAVLIAAGAAASWIGAMGRWPEKVSISGNEVVWPAVKDVLDDQIEVAQATGSGQAVVEELVSLRDRLDQLQFTGKAPEHPAVAYDVDVEAALRRMLPSARITRATHRSDRVADFVLEVGQSRLNIETKWRRDPTTPFRGTTMPVLLAELGPDERLLVISNALDVGQVRAQVSRSMGDRGQVVSWRGRQNDEALGRALNELLTGRAAGKAAAQGSRI